MIVEENMKCKKDSGFTLVELAIVIVIIGLITSGVIGAQSLIRSSERQQFVNQIKEIERITNAFTLEYGKPPGDLNDATSYWPASRNGNGDGKIDQEIETADVWEQLSNAELTREVYTTNGVSSEILAANSMSSELGNAYLHIIHGSQGQNGALFKNGGLNNHYVSVTPKIFGDGNGWTPNDWDGVHFYDAGFPITEEDGILVADLVSIDKKIDDGQADKGTVLAWSCTDDGLGTDMVAKAGGWSYDLDAASGCIAFFVISM
jgi:prepilin-type N-terminal cleavage/methylation domain-containing protein